MPGGVRGGDREEPPYSIGTLFVKYWSIAKSFHCLIEVSSPAPDKRKHAWAGSGALDRASLNLRRTLIAQITTCWRERSHIKDYWPCFKSTVKS